MAKPYENFKNKIKIQNEINQNEVSILSSRVS